MTSGSFSSIDPALITVLRDDRQRRDISDVSDLLESIPRIGLIHPPVIDRDYVLISGERRLTALRQLGWTSIPVQWADELTAEERQIIELDENVRRKNLSWTEECAAIAKYHSLRVTQEPKHTIDSTSKELGLSPAEAREKIAVAREIKTNTLVAAAPKYSTARNIVQREQSRRVASLRETASIADDVIAPPSKTPPLLNTTFEEWSAAYTGPRFNLIHCDFPYGVGLDKSGQAANAEFGSYEDSRDVYFSLLRTLAEAMSNVVADSAHLVFWFSMDYYEYTRNILGEMGWRVNPFPLIWFKSDNTGVLPDAQRGPRRVYETAFLASRGDRLLCGAGAKANAIAWAGKDKSIHMNEKPIGMFKHFLSMLVDEYSFVLDPTCGSANALRAAQELGAGKVLGLEKDTEFFNRAMEAYYE